MVIRHPARRAVIGGTATATATPGFSATAGDPVWVAVLTDENGPYADSGGAVSMRAMPVAYFGHPATLRADGRLLYDVTLYRVKRPKESHAPRGYYTAVGTLPASEAFLPMNPACA